MLEVLDPEQNSTFRDNYLAVPFDLSRVVFIATANVLDTIPGPLRDRMEIIQLSGYTGEEKLEIAQALPGARGSSRPTACKPEQVEIDDDGAARDHRALHARGGRAQPRARDRQGAAPRRGAHRRRRSRADPHHRRRTSPRSSARRAFENEVAMRTSVPGVATGLAWTPVGGDILFIEATRSPGSGKLILTGQLGEVMRESAQAALSLVKNRAAAARHRREAVREERHPRARAGGRHPEGRAERRRRHVHRACRRC